MRVTVYYGYALFLLTVVGLLLTLVPWFQLIAVTNDTRTVSDFSVVMLLVSFAFTALAPPLIGYLAGDSATRTKSKIVHHFNGVLFGVLGVWLWFLATMLVGYAQQWLSAHNNFEQVLLNLAPASIAALVTIALGVFYARHTKHQIALIDYKPYQVLLISVAILSVLVTGAAGALSAQTGGEFMTLALTYIIVPSLFTLVATLVGYWVLGKKGGNAWERVVRSLIAVGFAVIALTIVTQFAAYIGWMQDFIFLCVCVIVIGVWLSYLLLMRRALKG
ncbi:hypothetical protein BGO17_03575 [Candidatus Saccharibacteria bacterium 49-20]|nr:MAG: hypothetical protein BGO17_03575 [Candidatus Saccharibacteria bacterium 49-20]